MKWEHIFDPRNSLEAKQLAATIVEKEAKVITWNRKLTYESFAQLDCSYDNYDNDYPIKVRLGSTSGDRLSIFIVINIFIVVKNVHYA